MLSPRWRKLLRDLWFARQRTALMVIAIAVSLMSFGAVLSSYTLLNREVSRNYLGTHPASATLDLNTVDAALVAAVRQQPGIADAEARATVAAQIQVSEGHWRPLVLFVVPDFNAMHLNTFQHVSGAWPPPTGTMLVEQSSPEVINATTGNQVIVKTPNGTPHNVPIVGLVHDPGLAPSWQESTGYAYITPATLIWLGESGQLNELLILVNTQPVTIATINHTAQGLATWLEAHGDHIHQIHIPPPAMHPHQKQMNSLLLLLLAFSVLALFLSAILVATMINGMVAQQVRQIGMLKAIGARTGQVVHLYLVLVTLVAVLATITALPLSIILAKYFAAVIASLLNITLYSTAIPWWAFSLQVAAGLLIHVSVALGPILRGSWITVRAAMSDFGVREETVGTTSRRPQFRLFSALDRTLVLAARNTFRRRVRLFLTLGLLITGGALFISSLNVAAAWDQTINDGLAARRYNLEIRLNQQAPQSRLNAIISTLPSVQQVEAWNYAAAAVTNPDGVDVVRTYPDGGHGSLTVFAPPDGSTLVQFPVLAGRWLKPGDTHAVVVNQMARALLPDIAVGDQLHLTVLGQKTTWQVVGMVKEIGAQAAAYVSSEAFAQITQQSGMANSLRVVIAGHGSTTVDQAMRQVEDTFTHSGVNVARFVTDSDLRAAVDGHFVILIDTLIFMAVVMAIVGLLGLASTMSTNVIERTREFGVMKTLGSSAATIVRMVDLEGTLIGIMSAIVALGLALPLSLLIGTMVSSQFIYVSLPLVLSLHAVLLWLGMVLIGAALASTFPAVRAARLTIRETLGAV